MNEAKIKAPLGGKGEQNSTDRSKPGPKRSVLTDGSEIPMGLIFYHNKYYFIMVQ